MIMRILVMYTQDRGMLSFNDNIASVALGQMKPEDMAALVDEELEK